MSSPRFWLFLVIGQLVVLALFAMNESVVTRYPALQYLGMACIVGIFACIPPAVVTSFVAGQAKIGNANLPMVRAVQSNQVPIVLGVYVLIGVALTMAWPRIREDLRAERLASDSATSKAVATPAVIAAPESAAQPPLDISISHPAAGSKERVAILDAVRNRLKVTSRFRVHELNVAGEWAFIRATEVVELDDKEEQETDLTVEALLELPRGSTTGWWRIADYWVLPDEERRPHAEFITRVKQRLGAERLPVTLLPDDLR